MKQEIPLWMGRKKLFKYFNFLKENILIHISKIKFVKALHTATSCTTCSACPFSTSQSIFHGTATVSTTVTLRSRIKRWATTRCTCSPTSSAGAIQLRMATSPIATTSTRTTRTTYTISWIMTLRRWAPCTRPRRTRSLVALTSPGCPWGRITLPTWWSGRFPSSDGTIDSTVPDSGTTTGIDCGRGGWPLRQRPLSSTPFSPIRTRTSSCGCL